MRKVENRSLSLRRHFEPAVIGIWLVSFLTLWIRILLTATETMHLPVSTFDEALFVGLLLSAVVLVLLIIDRGIRVQGDEADNRVIGGPTRYRLMLAFIGLAMVAGTWLTFSGRVLQALIDR